MTKVTLGVSKQNFKEKPKELKNITFEKVELSLLQLEEKIKKGFLFCHNYGNLNKFKMADKTNANFNFANLIWFDFDHCKFTLQQLYEKANIKPTFAYTTFSNSIEDNRFRFIYIFEDDIKGCEEFQKRTNLILNLIFEKQSIDSMLVEKSIDFHSFAPHQGFFGSTQNCQMNFNSDSIISEKSITSNFTNVDIIEYFDSKCHNFSKMKDFEKEKEIVLESGENLTKETILKAKKLLKSKNFYPKLNNYENVTYSDHAYSYVGNQDIYCVNTFFGEGKKIKESKRNTTAFYQANVLKNINPKIELVELIATLMWIRNKYFENPSTYTDYEIYKTANNVKYNYENKEMGAKKYLIKPELKNVLTKNEKLKYIGKARRMKRDDDILPNFDCSLTVFENSIKLGKSPSTLYNCLKENAVKTKNEYDYIVFKEKYFSTPERNRSVRKMAEIAGTTRSKSERYISKIKSEEKES